MMSPGDYEGAFIKAADSETRKGLSTEEAPGEPRLGCLSSLGNWRKEGLGDRFRGLARDKLPLPMAPPVASLLGTLRV